MLEMALSAQDQFLAELHAMPRYSEEEQEGLVLLARQGDDRARHRFVESLLRVVLVYANGLVPRCKHLSLLDIVQIGSEILLEYVDRALPMACPRAYLLKTAKYLMHRRCLRQDAPFVVPEDERQTCTLVSLDCPMMDEGTTRWADILPAPVEKGCSEERDYSVLYDALSRLSEERRVLLARRFGLFGYAPTPPFDLAREMFPDLPVKKAYALVNKRIEGVRFALCRVIAASSTTPQETPAAFYTQDEIRERYGADRWMLQHWVSKGLLTRYPAPCGQRRRQSLSERPCGRHVYAKAEVDTLVRDWSPRRSKGSWGASSGHMASCELAG